MNNNLEKVKTRKNIIIAMTAFWLVFFAILLVHNITGTAGLHLDYSISKYVGLSFPSAIAFLIVNSFVSVMLWRYINPKLKSDMQRILIILIIVTLVLLSIFPIGLFDTIIPEPVIFGRTPISFLHVITSRTMFVAMAAFSALVFYEGKNKNLHDSTVQKSALMFFIYAAICIFVFIFLSKIFWNVDLIFESLYIAFFFLFITTF